MAFHRIMRDPYEPKLAGYPGLNEVSVVRDGMRIDYDQRVEMRDGIGIRVNVFRPDSDELSPVIIGWGAYGKHLVPANWFPGSGVNKEWISKYTLFEAPDPIYWTRHGYTVIYADPRGQWGSEGDSRGYLNVHEAEDVHDLIEWAGTQAWSNGKVALSGVSYFSIIQWFAAATRPPHLAAINPWEGFSDRYRDTVYHGGMLEDALNDFWWHGHGPGFGQHPTEDGWRMLLAHPTFDEYWQENAVNLELIEVPALVIASWSDQGLHTRGTLEGFKRIGSKEKWLIVHGRKKWEYQYQPENVERQRAFFDHFLKGIDTGIREWPVVQLEIRERSYIGEIRAESEWPIARTEYTRLYLDGQDRKLTPQVPHVGSVLQYPARSYGVQFEHEFAEETELTGYTKLHVVVAPLDSDDMDVFVALEKVDESGERIGFPFFSTNLSGPSALGWLRASHRKLDVEKSREYQPVHMHTHPEKIGRGQFVELDVEIWPSSVLFRKGERLRLLIGGRDFDHYDRIPGAPKMTHTATVNYGSHALKTGGTEPSFLLVPVIPRAESVGT